LNGKTLSACELRVGDVVHGQNDDISITNIIPYSKLKSSYDIINVGEEHVLYVNDILVHNCDFQQSGNTVIEPSDITFYEENFRSDPIRMECLEDERGNKLNKENEYWT